MLIQNNIRRFLINIWFFLIISPLAHGAPAVRLELLTREQSHHQEPAISADDWRWLRSKRILVLGIASPDYPPFGMSDGIQEYEGISADYLGVMAESLNIHIDVRRYPERKLALDALANGEIDLIANTTPDESRSRALLLSNSYASIMPVLTVRVDGALLLDKDLSGQRLAMRRGYLKLSAVEALYPNTTIELYDSDESAISAVAFNQADAVLSDGMSAEFFTSRLYSNRLRIIQAVKLEVSGLSFAVNSTNQKLLGVLNAALDAIPKVRTLSIRLRWGDRYLPSLEKVVLNDAEKRWIKLHPAVRVAVSRFLAPLSYFDENNTHVGVTAELLSIIEAKTDLKFDVVPFSSVGQMYEDMHQNKVQMVSDVTSNQERLSEVLFTRPYVFSPFVLITKDLAGQPESLDAMSGKTMSISEGHTLLPYLRKHYPQVHLLVAKNNLESLSMLRNGRSSATIQSEVIANYNLPRFNEEKLKIASALNSKSFSAFAVRRDEVELYSILEKALRSIPPELLNELFIRWRTQAAIPPPNWRDYGSVTYAIVTILITLLFAAIAWSVFAYRQARSRENSRRSRSDQLRLMDILINGTPTPMYVRDLDRRLLICNNNYLQVFSVRREDLIGKLINESCLAEAENFDAEYVKLLAGGDPIFQDREVHINGQRLSIYHWMASFCDAAGNIQGIIGGWLDITERKLLVEELRKSKEYADYANHAKTTFLATMSHEIRTPISAVIGMLELALKRADKSLLDRSSIKAAHESACGLLELIGDILDFVRIESGRLSLSPERANLRKLLESVVRVFDGLARQKGLSLELDIDSRANCDVLVDPLRLRQILSNLISNAIKFTNQGSISVVVIAQASNDLLSVQLLVKDTGIGISDTDQQTLFQPFNQLPGNNQHGRSGTGLGLVITQSLCEMMGGVLTLESVYGAGTSIDIRLELNTLDHISDPEPLAPQIEDVKQAHALHILVVDDSRANRQLLCEQLKFLGHTVRWENDGEGGVRAWRQEKFDVIITDCNMPVLNGYELAQKVRQLEHEQNRRRTSIFGFTANALPEEHARCESAGMDKCIFKPVTLDTLEHHLALLSTIPEAIESSSFAKFNILELDNLTGGDVQVMQQVIDGLLQSNKQDLLQLRRVRASGGTQGIPQLVHRIKGAARIVKAYSLIAHCEELELTCQQESDNSRIIYLLGRLESAMVELEKNLLEASHGNP